MFESVFAPLILLLEFLLETYHAWTGAYGVSIVLLSISVSALMMPLSIFGARLSREELLIQQKMAPGLAEVRAKFKGEQQYREQLALFERHGYRPIMALRSGVGLVVQIPFFIAAFILLREYPPLSGASFLFIDDLARPDGALGSVNLLPIVMTAISAVSSFVSTASHAESARARTQLLVVVIAFLVLLYNQPSGLVLYWTMNGVSALAQGVVSLLRSKAQTPVQS